MRPRPCDPAPRRRGFLLGASWLLTALATPASGPALAQVVGFDPADYGKAQLPMRQSTGDAATYIDANKGAFEPISELDPSDPLAALARPIGRIDIVLRNKRTGEQAGASCTGALLAGGHVLTNHHCLPVEGDHVAVKASILMDYVTLDGKGARRFEIEPRPLEWSARLDYAVTRVAGDPAATYGTGRLSGGSATGARSLMVIHHPMGRPKVMSRFRCMALKEQGDGGELRHRCDTLGGSSGSLLFDGRSLGVALHKEGGLDPKDPSSFNTATSMQALLEASPLLRRIAQAEGEPPAGSPAEQPVAGREGPALGRDGADTGTMNSILRGP